MSELLSITFRPLQQFKLVPLKYPVLINMKELLWIIFGIALISWYVKFLWDHRKFYEHARKIPGPRAYPIIGSAFEFISGKPYDVVHQIITKYPSGIVKFWFGPKLVFGITNPKYIEILLSSKYTLVKGDSYKVVEPLFGPGIFTALVPKWRKHRKLIMPAFNLKNLDRFVEVFNEQANILTDVMETYIHKEEFDVIHPISKCTLDIICETAMNVKVGAQLTNPDFEKWIARSAELLTERIFNIFYQLDIIFFNSPSGREFKQVIKKARRFVGENVIRTRKSFEENLRQNKHVVADYSDDRRKAFLDLLLEQTYRDNSLLTDKEFLYETMAFIVAGYHTTANTLGFIFLLLGIHQDVQDKVLEEILTVIGPDGEVVPTNLRDLVYLEKVIKESQRLFPVASLMERLVEKDIELDEYTIPRGSYVIFTVVETHRSPHYWPDPLKFDPERFSADNLRNIKPGAYFPFSYGPRNCAGPNYAMMSMKTLIATVLRKYRIKTPYKSVEDVKLKYSLGLQPEKGFRISLELR